MPSRIKIKVGVIEVEYEGEEKFIKDELPGLIKAVAALHEKTGAIPVEPEPEARTAASAGQHSGSTSSLTTSLIAAKLGCKKCPDLIIAACAYLGLVERQPQFTRKEITEEMKNATSFFHKNYIANLTAALKTLVVANRLNPIGGETYALSATEVPKLKTLLDL